MAVLKPETLSLLSLVRKADGPSPMDRHRVWKRVASTVAAGAAGGASLSVGTATAAPAVKGILGGLGPSIVVYLSIGAALGVIGTVASQQVLAPTAPSRSVVDMPIAKTVGATRHRPPSPSNAPGSTSALVGADLATVGAPSNETAARRTTVRLRPGPPPPASGVAAPRLETVPSLAREMQLLEQAQRELQANRSDLALDALDQYARVYPHGTLAAEAEATRSLARCSRGRNVGLITDSEAQAIVSSFEQRYPGSPLTSRIRKACQR